MSKEKFVSLCIEKIAPETAKEILKAVGEEMPIVNDCLYKMFLDKESGLVKEHEKIEVEEKAINNIK